MKVCKCNFRWINLFIYSFFFSQVNRAHEEKCMTCKRTMLSAKVKRPENVDDPYAFTSQPLKTINPNLLIPRRFSTCSKISKIKSNQLMTSKETKTLATNVQVTTAESAVSNIIVSPSSSSSSKWKPIKEVVTDANSDAILTVEKAIEKDLNEEKLQQKLKEHSSNMQQSLDHASPKKRVIDDRKISSNPQPIEPQVFQENEPQMFSKYVDSFENEQRSRLNKDIYSQHEQSRVAEDQEVHSPSDPLLYDPSSDYVSYNDVEFY